MAIRKVSGYLERAFDPASLLVEQASSALRGVDYDTLIGTGLSGALTVPILGRALDKNWAIVRKPNDSKHATYAVEGTVGDRWIFVDDQVASGTTLSRVQKQMTTFGETYGVATRYVGAFLYLEAYEYAFRKPGEEKL